MVPELFSAPVPHTGPRPAAPDAGGGAYFDGLLAGDPDPLVSVRQCTPSHDPPRTGGQTGFRAFVTETSAWLRETTTTWRTSRERARGGRAPHSPNADASPVAVVAERRPDGRIDEIRVYFDTEPLTGRRTAARPAPVPPPG
jgi:hypothetical protein